LDPSSLVDDSDVAHLLRLIEQARAHELRSDWGLLNAPREENLIDQDEAFLAFARRWFALAWSLPPQRDRAVVVAAASAALKAALEAGERPGSALARAARELDEFSEWSSFLTLFRSGLGYGMPGLARRIKSVVDFSGVRPVVDETKADAELALQKT
jgi:hypothetical protein